MSFSKNKFTPLQQNSVTDVSVGFRPPYCCPSRWAPVQLPINLDKTFLRISRIQKNSSTRIDIGLLLLACSQSVSFAIAGQFLLGGFILSLVSIPQAYLRRTSDVNGSNFSVSRLLCSLGNACSSKTPKYTFKSRSTRLTVYLRFIKTR